MKPKFTARMTPFEDFDLQVGHLFHLLHRAIGLIPRLWMQSPHWDRTPTPEMIEAHEQEIEESDRANVELSAIAAEIHVALTDKKPENKLGHESAGQRGKEVGGFDFPPRGLEKAHEPGNESSSIEMTRSVAKGPTGETTQVEKRWDCHEHRHELQISDHCSVYHPDHGQLCYSEKHYDCVLYFPVLFKDKAAAAKWIEKGCIAEIQEGLMNLGVGFVNLSCKPLGDPTWTL